MNRRFVFNCSINVAGGGVQNAVNFILQASQDRSVDWTFLLSPQVAAELESQGTFPGCIALQNSPAKDAKVRATVRDLVEKLDPALVYTMAGPAYVEFRAPHVLGLSNSYITNASWKTVRHGRSFSQAVEMFARSAYQAFWCRRADFWIFQTASSRDGFCARLRVSPSRTAIVPNSIGAAFLQHFAAADRHDAGASDAAGAATIFCPGWGFPHKALDIIPDVAFELRRRRPDLPVTFTLTVTKGSALETSIRARATALGVSDMIVNRGPFSYFESPALYRSHRLTFVPSILEVFSTSYLEAIFSERPLIAADLPFAREVCGAAARYAKPLDAADSATVIIDLLSGGVGSSHSERTLAARAVLDRFGTSVDRYGAIMQVLSTVANR